MRVANPVMSVLGHGSWSEVWRLLKELQAGAWACLPATEVLLPAQVMSLIPPMAMHIASDADLLILRLDTAFCPPVPCLGGLHE